MDLSYCKLCVLLFTFFTLYYKVTRGQVFVDRRQVPVRSLSSSSRIIPQSNARRTNMINPQGSAASKRAKLLAIPPTFPSILTRSRATTRSISPSPTSPTRLRTTTRGRPVNHILRDSSRQNNLQGTIRPKHIRASLRTTPVHGSPRPNRLQESLRQNTLTVSQRLNTLQDSPRLNSLQDSTRLNTLQGSSRQGTPQRSSRQRILQDSSRQRGSTRQNMLRVSSRQNTRQRGTCPTMRCPETSSSWCIIPSYYRLTNGQVCRGCGTNRCGGQDFEDRWKLGFG